MKSIRILSAARGDLIRGYRFYEDQDDIPVQIKSI